MLFNNKELTLTEKLRDKLKLVSHQIDTTNFNIVEYYGIPTLKYKHHHLTVIITDLTTNALLNIITTAKNLIDYAKNGWELWVIYFIMIIDNYLKTM